MRTRPMRVLVCMPVTDGNHEPFQHTIAKNVEPMNVSGKAWSELLVHVWFCLQVVAGAHL